MDDVILQSKKIKSTIKGILNQNKLSVEDRTQWNAILKIDDFEELRKTYLAYKDFYKEKTLGYGINREDNKEEVEQRYAYRRGTAVRYLYNTPKGSFIEIAHVARSYSLTWDEAAVRFVKETHGFYISDKIEIGGLDLDTLILKNEGYYEVPSKGEKNDY